MDTIDEICFNKNLALYFDSKPLYLDEPTQKKPYIRKLVEQPWQEMEAAKNVEKQFEINPEIKELREQLWDNVTKTLCNLDFIQAKAAAKMTYELLNDFNELMIVIPDNQDEINKEKQRQERLDKYIKELDEYSKGNLNSIEVPELVSRWTEEQINSKIKSISSQPLKSEYLQDFLNFLNQEAGNLDENANEFPDFTKQQAWNYSNMGPVGNSATGSRKNFEKIMLLNTLYRPVWNPLPQKKVVLPGMINKISISKDGMYALAASTDLSCYFWDLKSLKLLQVIKYHNNGIRSVSISPNGKKAIFISSDNKCIVWDLFTGQIIQTFSEHQNHIVCLAFNSVKNIAISCDQNNNCLMWEISSGKILWDITLKGHAIGASVEIAPSGSFAVLGYNRDFYRVNSKDEPSIMIVDLMSKHVIATVGGHLESINSISISPDEKKVLSCSSDTIHIWDLDKGSSILVIESHPKEVFTCCSVSPNFEKFICGFSDKTCRTYNLKLRKWETKFYGHSMSISNIEITADAKYALSVSLDQSCIIWDIEKGVSKDFTDGQDINALCVAPDNTKIYVGLKSIHNNMVSDSILGQMLMKKQEAKERSYSEGKWISGDIIYNNPDYKDDLMLKYEKTLNIWDFKNRRFIGNLESIFTINSITITPDGNLLISSSEAIGLQIYNLIASKVILELKPPGLKIYDVKITPNGKCILCGSRAWRNSDDNMVILWDIQKGTIISVLKGYLLDQSQKRFKGSEIYDTDAQSVAISPDGKRAIIGTDDNTCILSDLYSGKVLKVYKEHANYIYSLTFSPDGKKVLSGSIDNTCTLRDISNNNVLVLKGHLKRVKCVLFTYNSRFAITASKDKSIIIWKLNTGEKISRYVANFEINTISLSETKLCIAGNNNQFLIIDLNKYLFYNHPSIITIRRIWNFNTNKYSQPIVDCPLCSHRFEPPQSIIQTIIKILNENNISPDQSPCMELPDEAWEHPGLLGECPNCHEKLKFNPFFGSEMKDITDYYSSLERENIYQKMLDEADNAFNNGDWENANYLYLKLVQQGKFDINEMRFKMALCQINRINDSTSSLIDDVNILMKILQDKGSSDKALLVSNKLKERIEAIKQEEIANKKSETPWWKKFF